VKQEVLGFCVLIGFICCYNYIVLCVFLWHVMGFSVFKPGRYFTQELERMLRSKMFRNATHKRTR